MVGCAACGRETFLSKNLYVTFQDKSDGHDNLKTLGELMESQGLANPNRPW